MVLYLARITNPRHRFFPGWRRFAIGAHGVVSGTDYKSAPSFIFLAGADLQSGPTVDYLARITNPHQQLINAFKKKGQVIET
jgi:hypothetical protein